MLRSPQAHGDRDKTRLKTGFERDVLYGIQLELTLVKRLTKVGVRVPITDDVQTFAQRPLREQSKSLKKKKCLWK